MESLAYKPSAFWRLDDTAPFQDYSGYGRSGTLSGTERHGLPLSQDAVYSQAVEKTITLTFASPVYVQGKERDPFSLAATIRPTLRSTGLEAQAYRENLAINPSSETGAYGVEGSGTGTNAGSTTRAVVGTTSTKFVWASLDKGISIATAISGNHIITLPANKTYTISFSVFVESGQLPSWVLTTTAYQATPAGTITQSDLATSATGYWKRLRVTFNTNTIQSFRMYSLSSAATTYYVDAVMLEESPNMNSYFDGSMVGYEWAGTAHYSLSRTRKDINKVNLATDASNSSLGAGVTITTNVSYANRIWNRITTTGTSGVGMRRNVNQSLFVTNNEYEFSWLVANDSATAVAVSIDFCDGGYTNYTLQPNEIVRLKTLPFPREYTSTYRFSDVTIGANSTILVSEPILMPAGGNHSEYFDGDTPGAGWVGTVGNSASIMYISQSPVQILSNNNDYDGLAVNGTKVSFSTKYTNTGEARAEFDIQYPRKVDVVGVHTTEKNSLFIDGELVAEVDITDAQKADTYAYSDPNLYSGKSLSSQAALINNVGLYASALDTEQILSIHDANNRVASQSIAKTYGGDETIVSSSARPAVFDVWWEDDEDWNSAVLRNVSVENGQLVPEMYNGLTVAGEWLDSIELYYGDTATSLDSVVPNWDGENVTVETSLNGTAWTVAQKGKAISTITSGFATSGKSLSIRVTFTDGVDNAYLSKLNFRGYNGTSYTQPFGRTITYAGASVRNEYDHRLLHDDWGVLLDNQTLTISTLGTAPAKSVEVWIKQTGETPVTFSANLNAATKYVNGIAGSTLPAGEWVVMHFTSATNITGDISIIGDAQVGKVVHYPNQLTAPQVSDIVSSSMGIQSTRTDDTTPVNISEPATSVNIYAYDWEILSS